MLVTMHSNNTISLESQRILDTNSDHYKPITEVEGTPLFDLFSNRRFFVGDIDNDSIDEVIYNTYNENSNRFKILRFFSNGSTPAISDLEGANLCGFNPSAGSTKVLENVGLPEKYAILLQSLHILNIGPTRYFVCTDTEVIDAFTAKTTSKSFLWQGNNTVIYTGEVKASNTWSHIFGDLNGDGYDDIILNHGNKKISVGIFSEGSFVGSNELEPHVFDLYNTNERCKSGTLISLDIDNDSRDDLICFNYRFSSDALSSSNLGISNYYNPNLIPQKYHLKIIVLMENVVPKIDINNVIGSATPEVISKLGSTLVNCNSMQSTFTSGVSYNDRYVSTISFEESLLTSTSFTNTLSQSWDFSFVIEIKKSAGVGPEVTTRFGHTYTNTKSSSESTTTSDTTTEGRTFSNWTAFDHSVSVSSALSAGSCLYHNMSLKKYNNLQVPYNVSLVYQFFNSSSGEYITNYQLLSGFANEMFSQSTKYVIDNRGIIVNRSMELNTNIFGEVLFISESCKDFVREEYCFENVNDNNNDNTNPPSTAVMGEVNNNVATN